MTQYGPQGAPVSVPSAPTEPPAAAIPRGPVESINIPAQSRTAPLPGDARVAVDLVGTAAPVTPEEQIAQAEVTIASQAAQINAAKAFVMHWEERAARTLIKSDYQRGQRDATLACSNDLRGAFGI